MYLEHPFSSKTAGHDPRQILTQNRPYEWTGAMVVQGFWYSLHSLAV